MQSILAVLFLTVALICGFTSTSHLEAISQPSQGGGYPNYEPTTGATPDCLVTPKKYEHTSHTGAPPPPPTLRTYSILECCKTTYSGPNLQTQTTYCANYYEWKDQYYQFEHPSYGPPIDYVSSWGDLPPYHVYLKSIVHGGETISPPFATGLLVPNINQVNNAGTLFSKPAFVNPINNSTSYANSTSMNPSSNSTSMNPSSNSTSMNPSSNSTSMNPGNNSTNSNSS